MRTPPRQDLARRLRPVDNLRRRREMKPLKKVVRIKEERPAKEKVSREEALKRVKSFPKRKEGLIASIREGSR